MTEPTDKPLLDQSLPDEQQLEDYLKGDSSVSRQYRQLHSASVPADLDRLVLRQAEDVVKRRSTQRPAWVRWTAPLAVAASAVLVLSIVVETGLRDETALTGAPDPAQQAKRRERTTSRVPAAAPAIPEVASEAEVSGALEEKLAQDATVMRDAVPRAQNVEPVPPASIQLDVPPSPAITYSPEPVAEAPQAIAQSAPPPAPAEGSTYTATSAQSVANAAAVAKRELQAASIQQAERTEISASSADEARQEARSTVQRANSEEQHQYSDPEAWLKDIRQLRKENKQEEADREWRRFRAAFPAYEVAETDSAREAKK